MLVRSYLNISVSIFLLLLSSLLLFFLIIFNFFFLFIPFFSLQELLCALRVKSRLRHGGWLVGWLVGWFVFSDPFKRLPIFCQPFVGRNVKDFPGILRTYITKSTLLLLET